MDSPMNATADEVRSLFGRDSARIYLDAATYGLAPRPTVDVMHAALDAWFLGTGRWAEDWDAPSYRCREDFAALVGTDAENIAFIPAASVGAGIVAASLRPGDRVVVPDDEFMSTRYPLLVAARRGVVVRDAPFDGLAEAITPGTRLVAFSLVQMQTGRVADLAAIVAAAEAAGADVFVDASQGVPFVDVASVLPRIAYLVCVGYKHLLSPRGTGYFVVRPDRWETLEPLLANWAGARRPVGPPFGGGLSLSETASRFDVSRDWFAWLGAAESLRLLRGWRDAGLLDRVTGLAARLADGIGVPQPAASLVCVPVTDPDRARAALAAGGITASMPGAAVRFAPHVYNTADDIDRAVEVIKPFVARAP